MLEGLGTILATCWGVLWPNTLGKQFYVFSLIGVATTSRIKLLFSYKLVGLAPYSHYDLPRTALSGFELWLIYFCDCLTECHIVNLWKIYGHCKGVLFGARFSESSYYYLTNTLGNCVHQETAMAEEPRLYVFLSSNPCRRRRACLVLTACA